VGRLQPQLSIGTGETKIVPVKPWLTIVLLLSAICGRAFSQDEGVRETSVCKMMQRPEQFEGKPVKIRAQLWTNNDQFWLNDSAATSGRLNAFCGWLPAKFSYPTSLVASKAFATFTGRLIHDPASFSGRVHFLIETQADIYRLEIMNGGVLIPLLYDKKVNTFVRPENAAPAASKTPLGTSAPLCYGPQSLEVAPHEWFHVHGTPMVCGYVCNGTVPIRACTKG
jgi:hypothetical protein